MGLVLIVTVIVSSLAIAGPKFPDKGWHKGPYLLLMGGMTQLTNDKNIQTNRKFDGTWTPAVGLTFGWDIADWIGPMLMLKYAFATDTVGDGTVSNPIQNGREHAISISLLGRVTFLTRWKNISKNFKMLPYVKLGFTAHALYVNAAADANKAGSWGFGPGVGGRHRVSYYRQDLVWV